MHGPNRLLGRAAPRPGDAGDANANIGAARRPCADCHCPCGLGADGPYPRQHFFGNAQILCFSVIGVGDQPQAEHPRGVGHVG